MSAEIPVTLRTTATGARQLAAIVHWQVDGGAHCLGRLWIPAGSGPAVAIVSEIASNADDPGINLHFAAVADALISVVPPELAVEPSEITWLAHHGGFSYPYYDVYGAPETFTVIDLLWDGRHYNDDRYEHRLLTDTEAAAALQHVILDPVSEVLADLGWRSS